MKKKYIIIILLIFLVLLFLVNHIFKNYIKEQNVFDQMYYTRVHKKYDWLAPGNARGLFSNMKQLNGVSRDAELGFTSDGYFIEHYKSDYINEDTDLKISFYTNSLELVISYYTNYSDYNNSNWYIYNYNVKDKTLIYTTNDPENKEKNFLYNIFLKDWFQANPYSRYSLNNLGKFNYIDKSP